MRKLEYISTLKFRVRECNIEKYHRTFSFSYATQTLLSKNVSPGKKRQETNRIQNLIHSKLKSENRRSFRGDVALKMTIYVKQRNAPHIQSIPKFYIDSFFMISETASFKRKTLLLKDDRQIKYLNVEYRESRNESSSITIEIIPFSLLLKQINLVEECRFKIEEQDDWDEDDGYREEDHFYELRDHVRSKEKFIAQEGIEGYDFEYFQLLRRYQENYYHNYKIKNSEFCRLLKKFYSEKDSYPEFYDSFLKELTEFTDVLILEDHVQMELGGAPSRSGDGDLFKNSVKQRVDRFLQQNEYLLPSLVPISATILFQPPIISDKDLDNLARIITPILFEKFGPPTSIINSLQPAERTIFKKSLERMNRTAIQSDRTYPIKGFSSYCIIALPVDHSNSNGFVKLNIHDANVYRDLTRYVSNILSDCERALEDEEFLN